MKENRKLIIVIILILVLAILAVLVYQRTEFFRCKTNCSIKMEQEYKDLRNTIK